MIYVLYKQEQLDRIHTTPMMGFKDFNLAVLYTAFYNKKESDKDTFYFINKLEVKQQVLDFNFEEIDRQINLKTEDFEVSIELDEALKRLEEMEDFMDCLELKDFKFKTKEEEEQ